jgi:serine/threonine protein phosphatase PrpC
MNYQIASKSEKGRKKESFERNGDCCGWIDESGCVVLALADGVGSCADDSRASKTTCDLFLEKCRSALKDSKMLTEARLAQFCREIDPVLAVDNDMACFCAVVWYVNTRSVVWLHVGDTRIYRYNKAECLVRMTEDDHGKAVNIKVGGKLYTDHGAVVSATPIDNAIGDRGCDFHTGTFEFNPGDSVILCSDGMYNSSTFGEDVMLLLNQADLRSSIKSITTTDDDDNSLLILRHNLAFDEEVDLHKLMNLFDEYQTIMPFNTLIDRFSDGLESMLDASHLDVFDMADIVAFMKEKQLYPDKTRIERVFNKAMGRYNILPEGEEKQRFNMVCVDLHDILKWVFTHF